VKQGFILPVAGGDPGGGGKPGFAATLLPTPEPDGPRPASDPNATSPIPTALEKGSLYKSQPISVDTLNGQQWKAIDITRPKMLIPRAQPQALIFFCPEERPDNLLFGGGILIGNGQECTRMLYSRGRGYCYLATPGRWWVIYAAVYDQTAAGGITGTLDYLLADVHDPVMAAEMLSRPGYHFRTRKTYVSTDLVTTMFVTATENIYRKRMVIQNNGAGTVRIDARPTGGPTTIAIGGPGTKLRNGEVATYDGDSLHTATWDLVNEVAGTPGTLELVEYV